MPDGIGAVLAVRIAIGTKGQQSAAMVNKLTKTAA
jgi:hypothetical protein